MQFAIIEDCEKERLALGEIVRGKREKYSFPGTANTPRFGTHKHSTM